jgi:hypothetical protein
MEAVLNNDLQRCVIPDPVCEEKDWRINVASNLTKGHVGPAEPYRPYSTEDCRGPCQGAIDARSWQQFGVFSDAWDLSNAWLQLGYRGN